MSLLPVADIDTGERYRKDMGDLPALAASIEAVGLLHPIVVMGKPDGGWLLVAGERRLRACRDILGWERIHVRIVPGTIDLLQAERDENEVREPFTPSEAVAIAAALRPVEKAAAKERMEAGIPVGNLPKGRALAAGHSPAIHLDTIERIATREAVRAHAARLPDDLA